MAIEDGRGELSYIALGKLIAGQQGHGVRNEQFLASAPLARPLGPRGDEGVDVHGGFIEVRSRGDDRSAKSVIQPVDAVAYELVLTLEVLDEILVQRLVVGFLEPLGVDGQDDLAEGAALGFSPRVFSTFPATRKIVLVTVGFL